MTKYTKLSMVLTLFWCASISNIAVLRALTQVSSTVADDYAAKAQIAFAGNHLTEAVDLANQAISINPDLPLPYYIKGEALVGRSTYSSQANKLVLPFGCVEAYEKYLSLAPDGIYAENARSVLKAFTEMGTLEASASSTSHTSLVGDLVNTLQSISNVRSAMVVGRSADLAHDSAGQLNAAINAGTATVQTLGGTVTATNISPESANPIQSALTQQRANISAAASYDAALKAQQDSAARQRLASQAKQEANKQAAEQNTTTVAANSPRPNLPVAASNTMTSVSTPAYGPTVNIFCPASGFVPGVMRQSGDTSVGVPCKPGSVIYINGAPQFNTAGTNYSGITAAGAGKSGGGGPPNPVTTTLPNPSVCRDMGNIIRLDTMWTDATKSEVVGFFTNNSISDVTCTFAFHKNGQWTEYGQGVVKAGAVHQGGEQGGLWTFGADSSTIKYACYAGVDPVDVYGKPCNANVHFSGMTIAGTDK